jgi:hypothetical protein
MKKLSWQSLAWLCALAGLLGLSLPGCLAQSTGRPLTRRGEAPASGPADDARPCRFG